MKNYCCFNEKMAEYLEGFFVRIYMEGDRCVIAIVHTDDEQGRECAAWDVEALLKRASPQEEDVEETELEPEEILQEIEGNDDKLSKLQKESVRRY